MQGKEASEQETKVQSNVGIDISKCWLDAHVLPGNERLHVANTCAGIRRLKRWLSHDTICTRAAIEYPADAICIAVRWPPPSRLRDQVMIRINSASTSPRRQGIPAKTDQLDACVRRRYSPP